MKRTLAPKERQRVKHENIFLNIREKNGSLEVEVKLSNLDEGNYPENSQISLEAYNRINMERIKLGRIQDHTEELKSYPLPFDVPLRAKVNFRLKIIDPKTYKLLGYAENLKEEKYAKSLLNITYDKDVINMYKIDFENTEHPVLCVNPQLSSCIEQLKPILAEMALKDILSHLLLLHKDDNETPENKWFKFANGLIPYAENANGESQDENQFVEWINQVLCKFSQENKVIDLITKDFGKND